MYTAGHTTILADALSTLSDDARRCFRDIDEKELADALAYPDFPCGKIQVSPDAIVERMETCSLPNLVLSIVFRKLSLGNQSHNGFYSLWHSMTIDPDKTVKNVAKNVVEYVLLCLKLARERSSMFWLGFALHIVMDSYSPAHVLRHGFKDAAVDDIDRYVDLYDSELSSSNARDVELMNSIVADVVESTARGMKPYDIVRSYASKYRETVAFVVFDHLQRLSLKKIIGPTKIPLSNENKKNDILNFYYYPDQNPIFHRTYDLLSAVKDAGTYAPCVESVAALLELYARPGAGIKEFLQAARRLLLTKTFRTRCQDAETGFDISTFLEPLRRSRVTFYRVLQRSYKSRTRRVFDIDILKFGKDEIVADVPVVKNERTRPDVVMKTCRFVLSSSSRIRDKSVVEYGIIQPRVGSTNGYPEYLSFDAGSAVYMFVGLHAGSASKKQDADFSADMKNT